jgi:RNA polymerase sigma factor (sigma-70 family)
VVSTTTAIRRASAPRAIPTTPDTLQGLGAGLVCDPRPEDGPPRLAQNGDVLDFHAMCERWRDPLQRFATSYCRGDHAVAQDIVQETFLVAWNKLEQIKSAEHLRPWLYQVARFKAINWLRKRGPKGKPLDSIEHAAERGHDIADLAFDPLRRAMITEPGNPWSGAGQDAIARQPALFIGVIPRHNQRGQTTREVANLLQLNQTTVKMRLLRARHLLRSLVTQEMAKTRRKP